MLCTHGGCFLQIDAFCQSSSPAAAVTELAETRDITIDPVEIEDAIWVPRSEMMDAFAGTHPVIKPARKGAIAHFLLQNWLADTLE